MTQPWWLGGRVYDQIQVATRASVGSNPALGMVYQSSSVWCMSRVYWRNLTTMGGPRSPLCFGIEKS